MTIIEKLRLILKLSGVTQQELAGRLGVTFATVNRWINGKAAPRPKAQANIDELYLEYSGQKVIPTTVLAAKKAIVLRKRHKHANVVEEILRNPDIHDQFLLSLTYHTNRIEGSTLSEHDTEAILFHNAVLANKSLIEQMEAKNHQAALEYLFDYLARSKPITEELLLRLHGILLNAILPDAGRYRTHSVRILGTYMPIANYFKVPALIRRLVDNISRPAADAVARIAFIHSRFEQIHPFADGNGRIGRLLMHAMALKLNLAPVVVRQEKKRLYVAYLNKAQMKSDMSLLEDFVCEAILEGYRVLERRA